MSTNQRVFHYSDDKSNKFWSITLEGCSHRVQFGRIGTVGQIQTKEFPTETVAHQSYEKLIREKLKKGYVEVETDTHPTPRLSEDSHQEIIPRSIDIDQDGETWVGPLQWQQTSRHEPSAFDQQATVQRIKYSGRKIVPSPDGVRAVARCNCSWDWRLIICGWDWRLTTISNIVCSREEAHFWYTAMMGTFPDGLTLDVQEIAERLSIRHQS